jgi:hypothetical protein
VRQINWTSSRPQVRNVAELCGDPVTGSSAGLIITAFD